MRQTVIAIVPAAGLGTRFGSAIKKTFVLLREKPLLIHTLERLSQETVISEIIPVLQADDIEQGFTLVRHHELNKIQRIAPGGKERQDSIFNALNLITRDADASQPDPVVLIHDGARPVFAKNTVSALVSALEQFDGAIPGIPVKDTIKRVTTRNVVDTTVDRVDLRSIQTPQAFRLSTLKRAYDQAYADGYYGTDDASLVERTGGKIKIIDGSPLNIKVTTPEDMDMVHCILTAKELP